MNLKESANSVVILANQHNPTVFLGDFIRASGIINKDNEIRKEVSIITPAFAQVQFENGDLIQVDPDRLKIEGDFGVKPFLKGIHYIKALPHIACKAIGINFTYEIFDFELSSLVTWAQKERYIATGVNILFEKGNGFKNTVNFNHNLERKSIAANFNFEYQFNNVKFSNISMDILIERKQNIKKAEEVLHELLREK